ncbi:phospholipase A2 inhibitor NAI-like [Pelodytes ibericus]
MEHFLITVCIISALTATGYALSCIQCASINDMQCSGPSVVCQAPQDACMSSYTMTTMGEMEIGKIFARSCETRFACQNTGSISMPNGRIKQGSSCCFSDNCTPTSPRFPTEKQEKNGVKCPGCYALNSNKCSFEYTMECVGDEIKCINHTETTLGEIQSSVALQGCATKELCNIKNQELQFGNTKTKVEISCMDSGASLQHNKSLLGFAAFLLLKLAPVF